MRIRTFNSATESVTQILQDIPVFSGIAGSVDLFQGPSNKAATEDGIYSRLEYIPSSVAAFSLWGELDQPSYLESYV